MKWSVIGALTLAAAVAAANSASAQFPPPPSTSSMPGMTGMTGGGFPGMPGAAPPPPPGAQCGDFIKLREDAQQKGMAIGVAEKRKADRKEVCGLVQRYATAEGAALKFLVDNKTSCGVPDQAITSAKTSHETTLKFRTMVCSEQPQAKPKVPTLSEAIAPPSVDTAKNTKTGIGTFDTLTGNPLGK